MGRIFTVEFNGRVYRCRFCDTHLALAEDLISKSFRCRRGKAYLFNNVVDGPYLMSIVMLHFGFWTPMNGGDEAFDIIQLSFVFTLIGWRYSFGKYDRENLFDQEERMLISGMHRVADVFCCSCGQIVGWKYVTVHENSQKFKEGKYVLERDRIVDGIDSEFYIDTHPLGIDVDDN